MRNSRLLTCLRAVAVATAVTLGLSACSSGTDPTPVSTSSDPKNPVYFKYPTNKSSFDLVYLADKLGYFDSAGIKPKYVGEIDANQIIPLVGTGELDFGTRMASLSISAIQAGQPVKIIAAANKTEPDAPHMVYFVRKDSPITTDNLKALEGRTIAMNGFGACAEFVTKQYLTDHGVDVNKVNFKPTPDTQSEQAVATGAVDLAIIHAPLSGHAENNPDLRSLFSDYDLDQGESGSQPYSANTDFIKKYPAQTTEFVGILARTENWVNEHPEEARQYIADRGGYKVEDVSRYAYVNNALLDTQQIQYWIDTLKKFGKLPNDTKLAAETVATNEFNPYGSGPQLIASQAGNATAHAHHGS